MFGLNERGMLSLHKKWREIASRHKNERVRLFCFRFALSLHKITQNNVLWE
jgi:hypothetical protein